MSKKSFNVLLFSNAIISFSLSFFLLPALSIESSWVIFYFIISTVLLFFVFFYTNLAIFPTNDMEKVERIIRKRCEPLYMALNAIEKGDLQEAKHYLQQIDEQSIDMYNRYSILAWIHVMESNYEDAKTIAKKLPSRLIKYYDMIIHMVKGEKEQYQQMKTSVKNKKMLFQLDMAEAAYDGNIDKLKEGLNSYKGMERYAFLKTMNYGIKHFKHHKEAINVTKS
ncbi:tetratricopeptide repeat protein [Longirhabdus pacifica]|uniref:tetratricopeptide repeat protein n=1 Tax=Longirhabdus pacifica TaxID=2305227 RepID=UPI001008AC15|nr:tetratricopeptide repeat protein [Longirhabdus pacifica]